MAITREDIEQRYEDARSAYQASAETRLLIEMCRWLLVWTRVVQGIEPTIAVMESEF